MNPVVDAENPVPAGANAPARCHGRTNHFFVSGPPRFLAHPALSSWGDLGGKGGFC